MAKKKHYTIVGIDGNAFSIMGYVTNAMKECGCSEEEISAYSADAMSSDYRHLVGVSASKCIELNEI